MPDNQIFACPYGEYQGLSILGSLANWKRLGPQHWTFHLAGASHARRAELGLTGVFLLLEHRFVVTVNERLKLRFRNDASVYNQSRNTRWASLSQSFDPRFLRDGPNELTVQLELQPGMRAQAVKNGYLSSLRLSLE
ncbi:MAG: hypothetical protein HY303_09115 [Candidatus Wallbacteria bacterium]|nr:hypothetical protein [Candidatus Wallbacteria bacterium]